MFQDEHYIGPSVDIWALGIILYFLVTGTMPFKAATVASLKRAILEGRIVLPSFISSSCQQLIQNLLKRKAGSRYTMKQIYSCPWVAGFEWVGEDKGYRPYPRYVRIQTLIFRNALKHSFIFRLGPVKLSDTERTVQDQLASLGITEEMQSKHLNQGVRSPVIATYRILLHKQMRQAQARRPDSCKPPPRPADSQSKNVRVTNSKACLLL